MYDCIFRDLHLEIPFNDFTKSELCIHNVVPSQLHPNEWAAIQVFRAFCRIFRIEVIVGLFLHYFCTKMGHHQDRPLFQPFTTSYKNFKVRFFKVIILSSLGDNHLFDVKWKPLLEDLEGSSSFFSGLKFFYFILSFFTEYLIILTN